MSCNPSTAPGRTQHDVGAIARDWGDALLTEHPLGSDQRRVLGALQRCRTAALGGHVDVCPGCGVEQEPAYNSCRDRHCPKCQWQTQLKWVERRRARVLPVHYFHVVFTLPAELQRIARDDRARVFDCLMDAAAQSLLTLGRDPRRLGAELGVTAVLHTWTRDLRFHPHVHCVVTGGGLSADGSRWLGTSPDYLLPVRVMGALFRGKLLAALDAARKKGRLRSALDEAEWRRVLDGAYRKSWVVYCKRPFGGPEQVFAYLGRYTHRVAISNRRLLSVDDRAVCFKTKQGKTATLAPVEFLHRFLDHVLPRGFVKIRHYGLLSSSHATTRLEVARCRLQSTAPPCSALPQPETTTAETATSDTDVAVTADTASYTLPLCPACHAATLTRCALPLRRDRAPPRGPP